MKVKHVLILSILLTLFLSLASLSAAENMTESNLTSSEPVTVTVEDQMWEKNLSDVEVEVPEDVEGNFTLTVDDEVIYSENITEKSFKVPLKLPKLQFDFYITVYPPIDCKSYKLNAYLNGNDLNISKTFKVMKFSPDFNYMGHFPDEILKGSLSFSMSRIFLPTSSNGFVEVYLDGKLLNRSQVRGSYFPLDGSKFKKLGLGQHTFRVKYYNDTYYSSYDITHNFNVVNAVIDIPDPVEINHDDCISVEVTQKSTVKVYIDSKLVCTDSTDDYGSFILSLEEYLKRDSREVKVVVSNSKFTRQKTQILNVTYDFGIYESPEFVYGEKNIIEAYLPDTLNYKLLTVTINGEKASFTRPKNTGNNEIDIDISKFKAGNYSLFISYPGDARFRPHNETFNFTVDYSLNRPYYSIVYGGGGSVYLNLPADASGKLNVYVNGKIYKSQAFIKGHSEIKIDDLKPGYYEFMAVYDGADYSVENETFRLYLTPKVTVDSYIKIGKTSKITMQVPKNCKGWMKVYVNSKLYKVQIKNGKAVLTLKNLKVGEYDVDVVYSGEDGYESTTWSYIEVEYYKPKIRASDINILYKHSAKYKVKIFNKYAKAVKNKWVKFKIAKKTYKVKTNKKGVAAVKLSNLKSKTYKIKITCGKLKCTKKVHVKLLSLKVKKNKVQVKLYRALKGKTVTFKVDGKKFKVKTNSRGIAVLKVKNPEKLSATYKKSTVKLL